MLKFNFNTRTTMSETKPADLTLALQNATEGFTVTVDHPTDKNLIEIRQLLLPVLMKTKYDELTLTYQRLFYPLRVTNLSTRNGLI